MKVLVTGGAGFIGTHLVRRLVGRCEEVRVLDDLRAPHASRPTDDRVRMVRGDVSDPGTLDRAFAGPELDAVVHLAALVGVRRSLQEPERYHQVNVEGTRSLLTRLRDSRARLVFASSSSVYGERPGGPFREEDPLAPASPYAETKRDAEALCAEHRERYGASVTCLRFFTVYGPGQREDMAIHRFVRASLDGVPLEVFGDGASARDYTHVDDIVAGVLGALDRPGASGTYNLGSGRPVSLSELVAEVGRATGVEPRVERLPPQDGDVPITHADISLAARDLGYRPRVTLRDGLEHYVSGLVALAAPA